MSLRFCQFWLFLTFLVIPVRTLAQTGTNDSVNSLIIASLISLCLVLLLIIVWLKTDKTATKRFEKELNERYQTLEQRLYERGEKLRNINNQLYEEIANHEITEELLNETQDYMQNIINSMPSVLIGVTRTGFITHWNQAASEATNIHYKQALANNLFELAPELNIEPHIIEKAIEKQTPQKLEGMKSGHGNKTVYRDITIYPLTSSENEGAAIRIDDVTMRVNLENMIIHNEKMKSLGELAAGVAHEINNPMGIILQGIQNIKRRLSQELKSNKSTATELGITLEDINQYLESRKIMQFIEDIQQAGERATEIVKNMLTFARAQHNQLDSVDMHELILSSLQMAEQNLSVLKTQEDIDVALEADLSVDNIDIPCAPIEIQQVILNILSNAFHSFINKPLFAPLKVVVKLEYTESSAIITIEDNGAGMDAWTKKHIFDPFFTTKEVGKGTGLGLSISYYIVTERHQGSIQVESTAGEGSMFIISLPRQID